MTLAAGKSREFNPDPAPEKAQGFLKEYGFWWFGAGSRSSGAHTSLQQIKEMGYADDVEARRTLLRIAGKLSSCVLKT